MADDIEIPGRGYNTEDVRTQREPRSRRRRWGLIALVTILLVPATIFALWTWVALGYTYSTGERAGYVQKISKKGWLCKTWEGEIAMANLPGTMPQLFGFSVRDDLVAAAIEHSAGQRVAITYEQHRGVPTSCFGETQYYVTHVRVIGP